MNGLLLINKPQGLSSHDVVRKVRRICRTRKVGHAGTLDPLATGVLPVAVGQGTKVLQFLLAENKSYRATLQLGVRTDTLDSEGTVLTQQLVAALERSDFDAILTHFRGQIEQLPPMYSALKRNGVPLYKLARQGVEVEREPRQVRIDRLELLELAGDSAVIDVACSKGTYVRSLIADIGDALGCGAHMTALCRTATGSFSLSECIELDTLSALDDPAEVMLSPAAAMRDCPAVELLPEGQQALRYGIPPLLDQTGLSDPSALRPGQLVRLLAADELFAMARFDPLREQDKRGDFQLLRVFVG